MGDPLPAVEYIQILRQTGDKRQHTACVEMSVKGEQSTKQHPGKKVTGLYVCSGQKVSENHRVGVVCTDVVASAITLIMQSTVVCTLVHMT